MEDNKLIIDWREKEEEVEKAGRFYDRYRKYKDENESIPTETTYLSQRIFEKD